MSQIISGAKAKFTIIGAGGAKVIAYASNCSYNWNHNVQAIEALGDPSVKEHTELGLTVDFSCSAFRVLNQAAISLGLQPRLNALLSQPELSATITDEAGVVLLGIQGVKLISRAGSVDARGVWTETLNFVGRAVQDEAGITA